MTSQQFQVQQWTEKAGLPTPATPTVPDLAARRLRAKLIMEEAMETIHALGLEVISLRPFIDADHIDFESHKSPDLIEIADGIADSMVVLLGTAVACGIDMERIFDEVMRSNFSKFIWTDEEAFEAIGKGYNFKPLPTGDVCVTDATGKIMKPPGYQKANIGPILEAMK